MLDNTYLITSSAKTLTFVSANSQFELQKAFVKNYLSFIGMSERPPSDWPSIAILLATRPEYPVAPSLLVKFCKLALDEDPKRLISNQAYALALLRDGYLDECIEIIESDLVRSHRGSTLILALAYSLSDNKTKANALLQEFEQTMEANGEKLGSRKPESPKSKDSISNNTLDTIQWEVQGLLGTRQPEKRDAKTPIE